MDQLTEETPFLKVESIFVDEKFKDESTQTLPNFRILVAFIISYIFYCLSLQGCETNDIPQCLKMYEVEYIRLITYLYISALVFSFAIIMTIFSKLVNRLLMIAGFLIPISFYFIDNSSNFMSHGLYNLIFWFLFTLFNSIIMLLIKGMLLIWKYYRPAALITLILILYTIRTQSLKILEFNCYGWNSGFKGTYMNNSLVYPCQIESPKFCSQRYFDGIFDITKILNLDCSTTFRNDDWPYDYFYKELGYRLFENNKIQDEISQNGRMTDLTIEQMVPILDYNRDNYFLKLKNVNGKGEVSIDLSLSNPNIEEKQGNDGGNNQFPKNVMILFIDSTSRPHFKHKLPKTYEFLEKYYKSGNEEHIESFQFFKYHSLDRYTNPNIIPLDYGVSFQEKDETINYEKVESVYRRYREKGYVLGSTFNMCVKDIFDLVEINKSIISKIVGPQFHHEMHQLFCDANFSPRNDHDSIWKGHYAIRRRCLYGKDSYEYLFEFGKQFLEKYKDKHKVFRLALIDAHEGTGEVLRYVDDSLSKFLAYLFNKSDGPLSSNSALIFHSDHNFTMPGIYSLFKFSDFMKEMMLPFLYVVITKDLKKYEEFKSNLYANENSFMTAYDVNASLHGLIDSTNEFNKYGTSFFSNTLNENSCQSYIDLKNNPERCRCKS